MIQNQSRHRGFQYLGNLEMELIAHHIPQWCLEVMGNTAHKAHGYYPAIINKVYREPLANRFLASLCPFISQQIAEGEMHENGTDELNDAMALYRVVLGNFNDFYEKNLLPYIKYVKASAQDISQLEPGVKAWDLSLEKAPKQSILSVWILVF